MRNSRPKLRRMTCDAMEFAYYYKTSDGVRTRGTMKARNKEQVFAALRGQGIKAIKVERTGWRFPLWSLLLAAAAVGAIVATGAWSFGRPVPRPARRGGVTAVESQVVEVPRLRTAKPRARKRIEGVRELELAKVFRHPAEEYLAQFAEPGREVKADRRGEVTAMLEDDLADAIEDEIEIAAGDSPAAVELKRVVAGLKDEAATLLASGKGIAEIRDWFEGRQRMEAEYRRMILSGSETTEEKNARLRAIGMALADE